MLGGLRYSCALLFCTSEVLECHLRMLLTQTHDPTGAWGVSLGSFLSQENLREDNDTRCHL